jgi:prepilin-type N-terminal cleavage/methylation domain-containing protein
MKITVPSRSLSRSGFTLVELLVVIAIIAILAAVVTAGANGALNAAKRVKASNAATQLQTAIQAYYTEYGVYPIPSSVTTDTYYSDNDQQDWQPLMFALCGNVNAFNPGTPTNNASSTAVSNTRNIAYITPKRGDVDVNGILVNPFFTVNGAGAASNANPYFYLAMDGDYSGILGDSNGVENDMPNFAKWTTGSTSTPMTSGLTQGVAVWIDCDTTALPPKEALSKTPNFWIHTY